MMCNAIRNYLYFNEIFAVIIVVCNKWVF